MRARMHVFYEGNYYVVTRIGARVCTCACDYYVRARVCVPDTRELIINDEGKSGGPTCCASYF